MGTLQMTYGAVLSAIAAILLIRFAAREKDLPVVLRCAASALVMPVAWNSILKITETTSDFSHDLPFRPFPISWQDTGTGVFTLAGAALLLGLTLPNSNPRRVATLAAWTALAALLIDIYTY